MNPPTWLQRLLIIGASFAVPEVCQGAIDKSLFLHRLVDVLGRSTTDVGAKCLGDMNATVDSALNGEPWALKSECLILWLRSLKYELSNYLRLIVMRPEASVDNVYSEWLAKFEMR